MNKQLTFLLALTFLFLFSGSVYSGDSKDSPEFHFKEDEIIISKKNLYGELKPTNQGSLVRSYNSLNVPLTRLDYINIELDHEMNDLKEVWTDYAEEYFENNSVCVNRFDPYEGWDMVTCRYNEFVNEVSRLSIKIDLRYVGEIKRVQFAILISGLGKPKKSMKSFCSKVLKMAGHKVPGVYNDLTNRLPSFAGEHFLGTIDNYYVRATSAVGVGRFRTNYFSMECIKSDLSREIIYNKESSSILSD